MSQRKIWTTQQDNLLRYLREEQRISKWSIIAQKMSEQYKFSSRSGKQCRQRYHNHLDSNIVKTQWNVQEERKLYALHDEIGNKWATIAIEIPGRTDNCVKNHFYSKIRKSVRRLNKIISTKFKKYFKQIKTNTIYKLIDANEERHKNQMMDEDLGSFVVQLKNQLLTFCDIAQEENFEETGQLVRKILNDIQQFNKNYKKKKDSSQMDYLKVQDGLKSRSKSAQSNSSYTGSFCLSDLSDRSQVEDGDLSPKKQQSSVKKKHELLQKQLIHEQPETQHKKYHVRIITSLKTKTESMCIVQQDEQNNNYDILKRQGIISHEQLPDSLPNLSKDMSKFSKYSQRSEQNMFLQESQMAPKHIPNFSNVKQISFTQFNFGS